jgi:hypothetical protein
MLAKIPFSYRKLNKMPLPWTPVEKINNRKPDFKVRYRFFSHDEGGRIQTPYQGYRSDLHYEGEDIKTHGIYMVWPEFLNADGSVLLERETNVSASGEANMWILCYDKMKEYHRAEAIPGRKCWFMEGARKVAEANGIKISVF